MRRRPLLRANRTASALLAAALLLGACSDDGDDLRADEPEAGEDDAEVVPGEGGPVD